MTTETTAIREGEELNTEKLLDFLRSCVTKGEEIAISQFPSGSSNLTYLIKLDEAEYVLRRPPFGNTVKTAHDMGREYKTLSKLSSVYPPAPKPLVYCNDESIVGSEFYLMERRKGLVIRGRAEHIVEGLFADERTLENSPMYRNAVCKSFVQNLADLHALDYEAAGLGNLGKPDGYNSRQVKGWTKRYVDAKTAQLPDLERSIKWLNENIPTESGASLIHNDYKFDNVMLDPNDLTKITAVLDWEMTTLGDPLMDLGTTLGYWMSPEAGDEMLSMPFNPRVLMENITRREMAEIYAAASGRNISNILFYYVFGTFKIAAIAQQIYARYARGFTKDPRFSTFDTFVAALGTLAWRSVQTKSI